GGRRGRARPAAHPHRRRAPPPRRPRAPPHPVGDAMPAFFVTGTDPGVGKTRVSAGLLAHARARGLRVAALKPAETGVAADGPADGHLLRAAADMGDLPLDTTVPPPYPPPVPPPA